MASIFFHQGRWLLFYFTGHGFDEVKRACKRVGAVDPHHFHRPRSAGCAGRAGCFFQSANWGLHHTPLVCRDWYLRGTAASVWIVTLDILFNGCCAVRVLPPVWVWKRSIIALGSVAPRSFMIWAHMRRAARNLATSSNKIIMCIEEEGRRLPNTLMSNPFFQCCFYISLAIT